jgi:hypothetical protein
LHLSEEVRNVDPEMPGHVGGEQGAMPGVELRGSFQVAFAEVVQRDRCLHEALVEVRVGTLRGEPELLERLVCLLIAAGVEELDAGREAPLRRSGVPRLRIEGRVRGIDRAFRSGPRADQG